MNTAESNVFANLISGIITEKFRLPSTYTIFITTFISTILLKFDAKVVLEVFNDNTRLIHFFMFGLMICIIYFTRNTKVRESMKYLKTFNAIDINVLRFYMQKNPDFFSKNYNMTIGRPHIGDLGYHIIPDTDETVFFNDTKFFVRGKFITDFIQDETVFAKQLIKRDVAYLKIYVTDDSKYNAEQYLKQLQKYMENIESSTDNMVLYSVKVFGLDNTIRKKIYNGPKNNHQERYEKYMKSYFSNKRDEIWTQLYNIHYHPEKYSKFGQEARFNMLLYGPPGSGKSTFAYRTAMSLGRHIFSVDLTMIANDRAAVYKAIQTPSIFTDEPLDCSNAVILLEEFDITIDYFLKEQTKEKNGEHKIISQEMPVRPFEISDLLELLQGAVPLKGCIIIATTNKYEKIRETCPALFRPGRLTPIHFSYMDWTSFHEMCMHFFNKKIDVDENQKITVPTSEILDMALHHSLIENGFEIFEKRIKEKFSE